jgi:hypothetical protein
VASAPKGLYGVKFPDISLFGGAAAREQPVVQPAISVRRLSAMHEGACLGRAQMFEADGRDLAAAEEPASQEPAMPGDDPELGITEGSAR